MYLASFNNDHIDFMRFIFLVFKLEVCHSIKINNKFVALVNMLVDVFTGRLQDLIQFICPNSKTRSSRLLLVRSSKIIYDC